MTAHDFIFFFNTRNVNQRSGKFNRRSSSPSQLHDKFEQLKRMHQEEKRKVEEKRRDLEEEMNAFNRKKVAAETLSLSQPLKKDKDKKK